MITELSNKDNGRIRVLDIARGIGVFLVIAGHMPSIFPENVRLWIFSFHMPLFFLISGYFAKTVISRSELSKGVFHKIKKLLIPYLIYSLIYVFLLLLSNAVPQSAFSDYLIKILNGTIDGVQWFFLSLFFVSVFFITLTCIVKKQSLQMLIVLCIVFAGLLVGKFGIRDYLRLGSACYSLGFYYLGYILKKHKKYISKALISHKIWIIPVIILTESAVLFLDFRLLDLMQNYEIDILINYLIAVSGIGLIIIISRIIDRVRLIRDCIAYIGRNSLFFYPLTNFVPYFMGKLINDSGIISILGYIFGFLAALICSLISNRFAYLHSKRKVGMEL